MGKFGPKGEIKSTKTMKDTLNPKFQFSDIISIPSVTQDEIDLFESGAITIYVYGLQKDNKVEKSKALLNTKELKEMDGIGSGLPSTVMDTENAMKRRMSIQAKTANAQHVNRRLDYLERRDKRIQEICTEWKEKLEKDPSTDAKPFVKSGNKFKAKVQLISTFGDLKKLGAGNPAVNTGASAPKQEVLKAHSDVQNKSSASKGKAAGGKEGAKKSGACVIM